MREEVKHLAYLWLIVAVAVLALSGCAGQGALPSGADDDDDGANDDDVAQPFGGEGQFRNTRARSGRTIGAGLSTQGDFVEVWRAEVGAVRGMVVAGGRVFSSTYDQVVALDVDDGAVIWASESIGGGLASAPAVVEGKVVVEVRNGTLVGLDAFDGTVLWTNEERRFADGASRNYSSPLVVDGGVFVGGQPMALVEPETGDSIWEFEDPDWSDWDADSVQTGLAAASNSGTIGVVSWGAQCANSQCDRKSEVRVYGLSSDGQALWNHNFEYHRYRDMPGGIALAEADGFVLPGSSYEPLVGSTNPRNESLLVVDPDTGQLAWSLYTGGRVQGGVGIVDGSSLAVEQWWLDESVVQRLTRRLVVTGESIWCSELGAAGEYVDVRLGVVVVDDSVMLAWDADGGSRLASFSLSDGSLVAATSIELLGGAEVASDGLHLYVATAAGEVVAYDVPQSEEPGTAAPCPSLPNPGEMRDTDSAEVIPS